MAFAVRWEILHAIIIFWKMILLTTIENHSLTVKMCFAHSLGFILYTYTGYPKKKSPIIFFGYFGQLFKILDTLHRFGPFWQLWTLLDALGYFGHFYNFWTLLDRLGAFWLFLDSLKAFGCFWTLLNLFRPFWTVWTLLDILDAFGRF